MRLTATEEMEYLSAVQGRNSEDAHLIHELGRRLEALRRYDQFVCDADWHPRASGGGQPLHEEPYV